MKTKLMSAENQKPLDVYEREGLTGREQTGWSRGLRPWKHSAGRSCDYRQKGSHTVFLSKTDAGSVPPILPGSSLDGPCRCCYRSSELRLSM